MKTKKRNHRGKPDPTVLKDIVARIGRAAEPEKIELLGSAARGEMGLDSDYDLHVIKGGTFNYWRLMTRIYRHLPGTAPVDVVLATPEQVERYRNTQCLVICPILKEGKLVYDSETSASRRSSRNAKSRAR